MLTQLGGLFSCCSPGPHIWVNPEATASVRITEPHLGHTTSVGTSSLGNTNESVLSVTPAQIGRSGSRVRAPIGSYALYGPLQTLVGVVTTRRQPALCSCCGVIVCQFGGGVPDALEIGRISSLPALRHDCNPPASKYCGSIFAIVVISPSPICWNRADEDTQRIASAVSARVPSRAARSSSVLYGHRWAQGSVPRWVSHPTARAVSSTSTRSELRCSFVQ
jgi:hypothetical protein